MFFSIVTPTHKPTHLPELWKALEAQTLEHRWEWLIAPSRSCMDAVRTLPFAKSPRVRIVPYPGLEGNVGAAKLWAFSQAVRGHAKRPQETHILVELDHDDLLVAGALEVLADTFEKHPEAGFVYSNAIDWSPFGEPVTYHDLARNRAWREDGWRFDSGVMPMPGSDAVASMQPRTWPLSFEPSAAMMSSIHTAPNHVRAWRASVYSKIGGHDPSRKFCDDHELLIRTYLATEMHLVPEPLYFYRVDGANTWLRHTDAIAAESKKLGAEYLHRLVEREMQLRGLPLLDLGGGIDPAPAPWIAVDRDFENDDGVRKIFHDEHFAMALEEKATKLRVLDLGVLDTGRRWPFPDSSIGAIRAFDLLEHLPNRLETMREIYRVLAPGGWLLSRTPSAAGPGAYCDPTHVSYWVKESFAYYTDRNKARYLPKDRENPRFMAFRLEEDRDAEVPYVTADLVSLKDDRGRLPGRRGI